MRLLVYAWLAMALIDVWASLSSWLAAHGDWLRAKAAREAAGVSHLSYSSRDAVNHAIDVSACLNVVMASMLTVAALVWLFLARLPIGVLIAASTINAVIAIHGRLIRYRLSTGYYDRRGIAKTAGQVIADTYKDKEPP